MASIERRAGWNARQPCKVSGCGAARHGVAAYCQRHTKVMHRWGHPTAQPMRLKAIGFELDRARRIIGKNEKHPAVEQALKAAAQWLQAARGGASVPAMPHIRRLAEHERAVTPRELVETVAGFMLHVHWQPRKFLDKRHETVTLGHLLLHLRAADRVTSWGEGGQVRTRYRTPTARHYREAGEHAQRLLNWFSASVIAAANAEEQRRISELEARRFPLELSDVGNRSDAATPDREALNATGEERREELNTVSAPLESGD